MQADKRERMQVLENEVAIAGGIDGIGCRRDEAQFARDEAAVECERGAGHCARAKRAVVKVGAAIPKALGVAENHLNVSEKPVRNQHRLGALHVRVAGHDGVAGGVGLQNEGIGPCGERFNDEADLLANVERRSVAICSLRLRPVWSLRPSEPTRSTSASSTK